MKGRRGCSSYFLLLLLMVSMTGRGEGEGGEDQGGHASVTLLPRYRLHKVDEMCDEVSSHGRMTLY